MMTHAYNNCICTLSNVVFKSYSTMKSQFHPIITIRVCHGVTFYMCNDRPVFIIYLIYIQYNTYTRIKKINYTCICVFFNALTNAIINFLRSFRPLIIFNRKITTYGPHTCNCSLSNVLINIIFKAHSII